MIDYSNPAVLKLRRLGQSLGFLRPMVRFYRQVLGSGAYEDKFHSACLAAVRPGDTVWDIGANEGFYTEEFRKLAGPAGRVVAFEPSPNTAGRLRERFGADDTVAIEEVALSDHDGEADFFVSSNSTTDGLSGRQEYSSRESVKVDVKRGDRFAAAGCPQVVKIDVEGFELEVLRGLQEVLKDPSLRTLLVEVHFQVLNDRGATSAPREIDALLARSGLSRAWVDPSHIVATRVPAR